MIHKEIINFGLKKITKHRRNYGLKLDNPNPNLALIGASQSA